MLKRSQRWQERSRASLVSRECFLQAFAPRAFALSLALGLSLTGCSEPDLAALDNKLGGLRDDPSGVELPPVPELPHYAAVDYDQSSRRSPFRARQAAPEAAPEGSSELAPDSDRPLDPLEAYPLDKLMLVGTLSVGNRPSALVRAPGGEVHRLTSGDHMGADYGRIVSITERSVQLVEVVNNGRGGWTERTRQLTLDDPTTK
ncbi:pilus assembly protein PilP [Halomonas sp. I5-271120]|nr:pilus assembly protein PilP [Halomonas sp. I5-271120]